MVYPRYSQMFPTLKEVRDSLDNSYFAAQPGVEAKAQARWQQLFQFMVVKYNDMIIKPTKKDGSFEKTPYGLGATPVRPGYPEKYAKELMKQTGDKFLVPETK